MGGTFSQEKLEDRYFLQKVKLGQGSFGTVWRAVDRQSSDIVAIKQLDKAAMPKRGVSRQEVEREVSVMRAVKHDSVIRLLNAFEDQHSLYRVLEYCDGGDFGDKVKERGNNLQEYEAADWMRQIISAIAALHQMYICHRDIKPDNFMVHGDKLKLSDFGLAVFLPKDRLLTEKCGTPAFMAPEQHRLPRFSRGYNALCDIWAAGVTMYMLMFGGRHPFLDATQNLDETRLLEGQLDFSEGGFFGGLMGNRYSEGARRLCKGMVEPDLLRRTSAEDARQDPWLSSSGGGGAPMRSFTTGSKLYAAPPDVPIRGILQVGTKCRYFSSSFAGWMPAVVTGFNENDGTYNLDVRQHAKLKNISPSPDVQASESWPPGTLVHYESSTVKQWLPGVIISFKPSTSSSEGTYNLDVRDCATVDRMRPRLAADGHFD